MEETVAAAWDHYLAPVYAVYALFSVILTVWLARTLGTNGRIFLKDVFPENPDLADAVNRLLVVGFYLVNFGYACLLLEGGQASDMRQAIETLASKLGALLLSLAFMHFLNLIVFHKVRKRARANMEAPPLAPQGYVEAMRSAAAAPAPAGA